MHKYKKSKCFQKQLPILKILSFGIIKKHCQVHTKKIETFHCRASSYWKNCWNLGKSNLLALMLKKLALLIKKCYLLIKEVGIEGRVHVQLVKGLVNLSKFITDISRVKDLTRGLVVRGSKVEKTKMLKSVGIDG